MIAESQTLIRARFAGKPEPNLVEELKMKRVEKEEPEKLDYSNAPTPEYLDSTALLNTNLSPSFISWEPLTRLFFIEGLFCTFFSCTIFPKVHLPCQHQTVACNPFPIIMDEPWA
jgi:hypothetical protein